MRKVHHRIKEIKCTQCEYLTSDKTTLKVHIIMPSDTQYADDIDFYNQNETYLKDDVFPSVQNVFKERKLKVNSKETEFKNIQISSHSKSKGLED